LKTSFPLQKKAKILQMEGREMKSPGSRLANKKFYIHTFGCQMNENDSERISGILRDESAQPGSVEDSDIIIINTCAVRKKSEEKLYSFLGRLADLKKRKDITVGVVGCVAQLYRSGLIEEKPIIDFVMGPDNYGQILDIITNQTHEKIVSTQWRQEWLEVPSSKVHRKSRTSAYVTIMEGCDNFCAYCIVPFTRGREKFRPEQHILGEIRQLALEGYLEIQLLGQNVNSYRDPKTGSSFEFLLEQVNRIQGIQWIRFLTSHPKNLSDSLARTMKDAKKICHQLHLPLQAGSSRVLKKMKRGYTKEDYLEKIQILRSLMPDMSFSTDIIVGFPGEDDDDFEQTIEVLKTVRFTNIFSFRYSPRPRTAAAKIEDSVPFEVKRDRLLAVQDVQKQIQLEHNSSLIGKTEKVLCLGKSKKDHQKFSGRNEAFQVVNFFSDHDVIGHFVNVHITSCGPYSLHGEIRDLIEKS
jgi:tRNA-2-methylthio-N6-dimethylallyladenosine synthase